MNTLVTSQYQPRLSSMTNIFSRRISKSDQNIQIKLNYIYIVHWDISFASFYDFSIRFQNWSPPVCYFSIRFQNWSPPVWYFSILFQNWSPPLWYFLFLIFIMFFIIVYRNSMVSIIIKFKPTCNQYQQQQSKICLPGGCDNFL